ncbi:MAG: QueT transporter family protein [Defluviitaleaceae bacterium]|nr:QueT transporter family protein [Defluviitaleaceae bacterium]
MKKLKEQLTTRNITKIGATAAIYFVLTLANSALSFGDVQFRISEILNLLAFINPIYGIGVVIGCFLANLTSPLGLLDPIFGTFATLLAVICISKTRKLQMAMPRKLFIATLWPTIFSGPIVGFMLFWVLELPFFISTMWVSLGQFVVVTLAGYPIFRILHKNKALIEILKK